MRGSRFARLELACADCGLGSCFSAGCLTQGSVCLRVVLVRVIQKAVDTAASGKGQHMLVAAARRGFVVVVPVSENSWEAADKEDSRY